MSGKTATQQSSFVVDSTEAYELVLPEGYSEILGQKLEALYFELLFVPPEPREGRGTVVRLWRHGKRFHSIEMYSPHEGVRIEPSEEWSVVRVGDRIDMLAEQANQRLNEVNTRLLAIDGKLDTRFSEVREEIKELRKEVVSQSQFRWVLAAAIASVLIGLLNWFK